MSDLISVIIPVYNSENYLKECLDSVVNQTFKDIEIICINNGSTDNSEAIIKSFAEKYKKFIFFNEKNKIDSKCVRDLAIGASTGDYILILEV